MKKHLYLRSAFNDKVDIELTETQTKAVRDIAKELAEKYKYYYYIPKWRTKFNNKYAYFYYDTHYNHLVKVEPKDYTNRRKILHKKGYRNGFYIGFKVPYYE